MKQIDRSWKSDRFRDLLSTIVYDSNDAIILFDLKGKILAWNKGAQKIYGYSEEEAVGSNIMRLIPNQNEAEKEVFLSEIIEKKQAESIEAKRVSKTGNQLDVWITASTVLGENGDMIAIVTTERDITNRKWVEKELREEKVKLEEAYRLIHRYVSLVIHDLRAPLASLIMALRFIQGRKSDENQFHDKVIAMAINNGDKMSQLIELLLDASKLRLGAGIPKQEEMDAFVVATSTIQYYEMFAKEKEIELINEVPVNSIVFSNPKLIQQILGNLVFNAIKYSSKGGRIRIFLPDNSRNCIAVADTGVGIDIKKIEQLFKFSLDKSTRGTKGEMGLGMGLYLAQDIMRSLGGEITVNSEVGKGSTFYIWLKRLTPCA